MIPDFNKKTVETLAKRAAHECSNPDCRVSTIGPNSESDKSTSIGEAAHIYGARPNSKRFLKRMTDSSRAEITNSIWLCRNCHKLIDTDENKYPSEILFKWRDIHEEYITSKLGSKTDKILYNEQKIELKDFEHFPSVIKRIIIDKPEGWEWRLAAELLRYFNNPLFRKLDDLKDGLYIKDQEFVNDTEVNNWISNRLTELTKLTNPIALQLQQLNKNFGPIGKPGNYREILHTSELIKNSIEQIIKFEERVHFAIVSEKYNGLMELIKNAIGSQVKKLSNIPESLDKIVAMIGTEHGGTSENPLLIQETITFELPDNWQKQFNREINKIQYSASSLDNSSSGCLSLIIILLIVGVLFFI
ncbi:MAG: hypothetical protein HWD85_10520 [Flavobacteriaceae bacterium]|nr:hypothetical protein [Flavobacteriaceae bacterium]